jgi:hypothetical protein
MENFIKSMHDLEESAAVAAPRFALAAVIAVVAYVFWVGPSAVWYAFKYHVPTDKVDIAPKPTDCDLWHAPVGFKDCHYEKLVWAYSPETSGRAEYRYDLNTHQLIDLRTNEVAQEPLRPSKSDSNVRYDSVHVSWQRKPDMDNKHDCSGDASKMSDDQLKNCLGLKNYKSGACAGDASKMSDDELKSCLGLK